MNDEYNDIDVYLIEDLLKGLDIQSTYGEAFADNPEGTIEEMTNMVSDMIDSRDGHVTDKLVEEVFREIAELDEIEQ